MAVGASLTHHESVAVVAVADTATKLGYSMGVEVHSGRRDLAALVWQVASETGYSRFRPLRRIGGRRA